MGFLGTSQLASSRDMKLTATLLDADEDGEGLNSASCFRFRGLGFRVLRVSGVKGLGFGGLNGSKTTPFGSVFAGCSSRSFGNGRAPR